MKFLKIIADTVDSLNLFVGKIISWFSTILVAVVCYDVFTRYVMHNSSVAVQELEWHIFALMFLMAAGYTLKLDHHVRVDVLYSRFSPKTKAWVNLLGTIFFLLPYCVVVIKTSIPFAMNSYMYGECSPDPGGLPYRWVLKSMVAVGFALLFLQGLSLASRSALTIAGKGGEADND